MNVALSLMPWWQQLDAQLIPGVLISIIAIDSDTISDTFRVAYRRYVYAEVSIIGDTFSEYC